MNTANKIYKQFHNFLCINLINTLLPLRRLFVNQIVAKTKAGYQGRVGSMWIVFEVILLAICIAIGYSWLNEVESSVGLGVLPRDFKADHAWVSFKTHDSCLFLTQN